MEVPIKVLFPEEKSEKLEERISKIHAEMIIKILEELPEIKREVLLDMIIQELDKNNL